MSSKPTQHNSDELIYDKISQLISWIYDHYHKHGKETDIDQIMQHIQILLYYKDKFWDGTSNVDNFLTLDQIEKLVAELKGARDKIDLDSIIEDIRKIKGEDLLIN